MISLKTSNNIFYNKRVTLDYLESDVFQPNKETKYINWLELRMSGEDNEEGFKEFLEGFLSLLKEHFFIDIFCYERSERTKNRLRSYGKLFYELRKEKLVSDQFLIEKELDTGDNQSIFTGIIQVNKVDNEIILNEILGNYFKFGHAALKRGMGNPSRLQHLLDGVDLQLLRRGKLIELDHLTLINRLVSPTSMVFSFLFDGRDDLVFTVYCGNEISNTIEEIMLNSLPKDMKMDRISADSKEVDRLIDAYFKDWRRTV